MKKRVITLLIVLGVIFGGVLFYFSIDTDKFPFGENDKSFGPRGNFNPEEMDKIEGGYMKNLTEEKISEVKTFFDSNLSDEEIEIYCRENRNLCMYYCVELHSKIKYCEELFVILLIIVFFLICFLRRWLRRLIRKS